MPITRSTGRAAAAPRQGQNQALRAAASSNGSVPERHGGALPAPRYRSRVTTSDEEGWLSKYVGAHGGVAGSVHRLEGGALVLKAAFNLPPPVIAATRTIPKGKGMAGLAWERGRPVTTCNLKTDETGDVRPGAKAVDAAAAVALPV